MYVTEMFMLFGVYVAGMFMLFDVWMWQGCLCCLTHVTRMFVQFCM